MIRIASLFTGVMLSCATMLFAIPAVAQVGETSVSGQVVSANDDAKPALTLAEVESLWPRSKQTWGLWTPSERVP